MICRGCSIDKNIEQFPVRKDRSNKPRPYCNECAKDAQRARYKAHKRNSYFKHKCTRARSRSQSLKVPFDLSPEYLETLWTGYCPVSKKELKQDTNHKDDDSAELDRFFPEKGYVQDNVFFLSRRINRIKNNANLDELKLLVEWMECKLNM